MTSSETLLLEKLTKLERRLANLERLEFGSGSGSGDMLKSVYDTDDDGQVDAAADADTLDGSHASDFAPAAEGVSNGNSHDHAGGDGAQIDHGGLSGLADDDHSQYHNDTRGDLRYAPIAKGVTNGDTHNHAGGDGAQVDHGGLGGLSDDDHTQYMKKTTYDANDDGVVDAADTAQTSNDTNYLGGYTADEIFSKPCHGRLTLESGVPVSTTDQSGKTTLYFTPFRGSQIALYPNAEWVLRTFSEISISLVGLTASKPYDVFAYDDDGDVTLEVLVWTNATTRATALTTQDGVLVKNGATSRRYLGTIYINSSGGQTDDTIVKRNVWNYANRVERSGYVNDGTAHNYNGAGQLWNNTEANNRIEFVIGVVEEPLLYALRAAIKAGADGSYGNTYIETDGGVGSSAGSGVNRNVANRNNQIVICGDAFHWYVTAGFHYVNCYELSNHASTLFNNMTIDIGLRG